MYIMNMHVNCHSSRVHYFDYSHKFVIMEHHMWSRFLN